ncbi:MAG: phosphatidylglycerol lysyltransferase domain-containing protein, partial [Oscillospiraceae bacterium]|nr:phosphatidylglycerol lysyltransferase domain-containing protein [Oscillospiraceae bacterium]
FGERSAENTFVVHVEKALRKYQGAYAAINREFVKSLGKRYTYINREEDTGAENLRKAKMSYNPIFLEEKFLITF